MFRFLETVNIHFRFLQNGLQKENIRNGMKDLKAVMKLKASTSFIQNFILKKEKLQWEKLSVI